MGQAALDGQVWLDENTAAGLASPTAAAASAARVEEGGVAS